MLQPRTSLLRRTANLTAFASPRWYPSLALHQSQIRTTVSQSKRPTALVSGATSNHLPVLKPVQDWLKIYPLTHVEGTRDRAWVSNQGTARDVVESYGLDDGGPPKTVVEIYPGPGALTRMLLTYPRSVLQKLIVLEYSPCFHGDFEALAAVDDRLHLEKEGAYYWHVWQTLQANGHFDHVPRLGFDEVHPSLRIVGHIPVRVLADQWVSQILRHVADRAWMWNYGRIPIHLLLTEKLWKRLAGSEQYSPSTRCKLSVIAQASCDLTETIPASHFKHYDTHFQPPSTTSTGRPLKSALPHLGVKMVPKEKPLIDGGKVDEWDFVLRQLFVNNKGTLRTTISTLAPGAAILLPKITSENLPPERRVDIDRRIRDLPIEQWSTLVDAFNEWPFKPEILKPMTAAEVDHIQMEKKKW
ncbi:Mitochondrial transcription factor 1 [Tulasnella sp. 403]|nr:Mitochondrial transcription factor 1 [Tulasnella sp. 403]